MLPTQINDMLAQLGGRRIFAMAFTGSSYSTTPAYALTLRVAPALVRSTPGKGTHVVVTLDASDTYTVEFFKVRGASMTVLATVRGVYADGLRTTVERLTGLALTLGTMTAGT